MNTVSDRLMSIHAFILFDGASIKKNGETGVCLLVSFTMSTTFIYIHFVSTS